MLQLTDASDTSRSLRTLVLVQALRPDRLLQEAAAFAQAVFGRDMLAESAYDLGAVVQDEAVASSPICLASVPGHDAAYRVQSLVSSTNVKCTSIALGSAEGTGLADKAIAAAARAGTWVCLQNVHLDVAYLSSLEKRLSSLGASPGFRLFLISASTCLCTIFPWLTYAQWRPRRMCRRRSSGPVV